jgi:hypothetical protein
MALQVGGCWLRRIGFHHVLRQRVRRGLLSIVGGASGTIRSNQPWRHSAGGLLHRTARCRVQKNLRVAHVGRPRSVPQNDRSIPHATITVPAPHLPVPLSSRQSAMLSRFTLVSSHYRPANAQPRPASGASHPASRSASASIRPCLVAAHSGAQRLLSPCKVRPDPACRVRSCKVRGSRSCCGPGVQGIVRNSDPRRPWSRRLMPVPWGFAALRSGVPCKPIQIPC